MGGEALTTMASSLSTPQAAVEREQTTQRAEVTKGLDYIKIKRSDPHSSEIHTPAPPRRKAGTRAKCRGREGIMPVDELIDQLASLSLRAGPALQEGTSEKLEYKDNGKF